MYLRLLNVDNKRKRAYRVHNVGGKSKFCVIRLSCRKVPTTPFHIVKAQQDDSSIEGLIRVAIDVTSSKTSIKKFSSTNGTANPRSRYTVIQVHRPGNIQQIYMQREKD